MDGALLRTQFGSPQHKRKSCLRTSTNAKMPSCGPSHVAQAGIQLAMHWGIFNWPHTSLVLGSQACASVLSCPNAENRALGLPPCAQASVQQTHAPSPRKTFLTQPQKWIMAKGHHISPTWQTTLTSPLQSPRHRFPDKNWKNKVEGKVHKLLQSQQTRVGLGTIWVFSGTENFNFTYSFKGLLADQNLSAPCLACYSCQ